MPLEEREKELYRRDEFERQKPKGEPIRLPVEPQKPGEKWGRVEAMPQLPAIHRSGRKIFSIILWGLTALLILGGGAYFLINWLGRPNVTLAIEGPQEIRAGERASYEIIITNSSRGSLTNTSLTFRASTGVLFPDTSERIVRKELREEFPASTSRREKISFYFLGKEGDMREFEVSFRYRLPNIASEFVKTEVIKVKIAAPAVTLTLNLPKQTLSSRDFTFSYEWKNISELDIKYLAAEFVYPEDFAFVSATPSPEEGKRWQFQILPANATGSVAVVGRIGAQAGQVRTFRALLTTKVRNETILLGETSGEISVIENPLVIAMSVNGETSYNANPGEQLEYRITFKNNFAETLRDIVIVAKLNGKMFDVATIDSDGAFDSRQMTITFHGGNSPQLLFLNPQESGSVAFRIKILDSIPRGLRQNIVSVSADITSATRPRYLGIEGPVNASASIDTKINGSVSFSRRVFLRDVTSGFQLVGPWPLRANQTTQMTVHWIVSATGNDFSNLTISSVLPGGVNYLGYVGNARARTDGTQIMYNPSTGRIEWQIPNLAAFQSKELIFQIGVTPSVADVGKAVKILNEISLSGTDTFTSNRVTLQTQPLRSDEIDDPSVRADIEGRVTE